MKIKDIPFGTTTWAQLPAERHEGETGFALWRTQKFGDLRVRIEGHAVRAATPAAPADPTLRDVQLALARECGFPGWTDLRAALDDLAALRVFGDRDEPDMVAGAVGVADRR